MLFATLGPMLQKNRLNLFAIAPLSGTLLPSILMCSEKLCLLLLFLFNVSFIVIQVFFRSCLYLVKHEY